MTTRARGVGLSRDDPNVYNNPAPFLPGYYARVKSIHLLVDQFLDRTQQKCQLVTYGAGSDTLHWLLWKRNKLPALHVEVDFPAVTSRKCHCIKYIHKYKYIFSKMQFSSLSGQNHRSPRHSLTPPLVRIVLI